MSEILLAMLYVRRIMGGVTIMALQIFGAVLGVLQVALAVQMILCGSTISGCCSGRVNFAPRPARARFAELLRGGVALAGLGDSCFRR